MGENAIPPFSEMIEDKIWRRKGDPPPIIYRLLDEKKLARLAKLEIGYKLAVLKAGVQYYEQINELMRV